jgi:hypothetical protein
VPLFISLLDRPNNASLDRAVAPDLKRAPSPSVQKGGKRKMKTLWLMLVLVIPLIAREPLAQRIAHTDPAKAEPE